MSSEHKCSHAHCGCAPRHLVVSVDYEIFGNGEGDVRQHVVDPTERMAALCEKYGAPLTVFFEVEEYLAFEKFRDALVKQLGYDPAALIRAQIIALAKRGHDIQLHLHPEWYRADYKNGKWILQRDKMTVDSLFETQEETTSFIGVRKAVIEKMLAEAGRQEKVTVYRAGAFSAQPGTRLLPALAANGFVIDSSVVKGLVAPKSHGGSGLDYRNAPSAKEPWRVSRDVIEADPAGPIWEVPIYSKMGRRFQQVTLRRLRAKFSKNIPKAQKADMVQKLGVKKNPVSILKFLAQPIPIKLDYHNQPPQTLVNWSKSAPASPKGNLDVVVMIGHTKEHTDDAAFEKFLAGAKHIGGLKVSGFGEIAELLRPEIKRAQRTGADAFTRELMDSTATAPMQNETATNRARDTHAQAGDAAANRVATEGIARFEAWLDKNGIASFDPYDVWGTKYGVFARRVYYEKGKIALPLIAPILALEFVCPSLRSWFVKKDRFATADGQLTTAFLNLYHVTNDRKYLDKAIRFGEDMLQYSVPGYSGDCWGYPFDWQNNRGLWKKNTPYITCTPYCFAAYLGLYDATAEQRYLDIARSIATFVYTDLKDTPTGADAAAASYSPMDATKVVNASAYRAWVLFEADARFNLPEYKAKAQRNLNFILQSQRADGAWLYATEGSGEGFIDNFHTAFVLKNLYKINQRLKNPAVDTAIKKGWEFYRRELFQANGDPKSFAIEPRTQIVKLEMYNFAEGITLGALLKDFIPDAFTHAQNLANTLCSRYQLREGYFVTRVFKAGFKHTFPFLRWPQAQLFYSLTNLLQASQKGAQQ